jgi:hypothetical protein
MSLPTAPVTVTQTIPSYLYFEYQDDQNLPALITSYNQLTQEYVTWFADVSLPVYTGLSGALLDWIGQGIYGLPRPNLSSVTILGMIGQIGSAKHHGAVGPNGPIPNDANSIATTQIYESSNNYTTPDDIYQRILTWWFFKGDGKDFSIPWLKRRISRFLRGTNGTNVYQAWEPGISVAFNDATSPLPTCTITLTAADFPSNYGPLLTYLQVCVSDGVLLLPFQFQYTVTIA